VHDSTYGGKLMTAPKGKLVNVYGKKMHIRQMGSAEKTIVLLPGFGIPLPTTLFAPLMRELSLKYKVCAIDLFGYGYSDSTDQPRTNENIVEEIRETLRVAGLKPPYVLMPYSASGIYCEYYTSKYPEEVEALILLESTPTIEAFAEQLTLSEAHVTGMKMAFESMNEQSEEEIKIALEQEIAELAQHGFAEEETREANSVPNHNGTLIAQAMDLSKNIREVMTIQFPEEIPVLKLVSGIEGLTTEEIKTTEKYHKMHQDKLGKYSKFVRIQGSTHSDIIYLRDSRKLISKEIETFLNANNLEII